MNKFTEDDIRPEGEATTVEPASQDTTPEGEVVAAERPSFEEVNSAMFVTPAEEVKPDWDFAEPSEEIRQLIQEALFERGIYIGKRKGQWGSLTIFAIQEVVSPLDTNGWRQKIKPGIPDRELCILVRKYAEERGGYPSDPDANPAVLEEGIWGSFLDGLQEVSK
jgi:hypothetical protein